MARTITVYQVWDGSDMAQSDTWWPTLKQAREYIAETYGIPKSTVKLTSPADMPTILEWDGETEDGVDVHCMATQIEMNAEGVCNALTHEPNR